MPERSQLANDGPRRPDSGSWYRVRTGDSLWSIAAATSRSWDPELLVTLTKQIHALNRAVIGPDPDLILPGQLLRLPSGMAG